MKGCKGMCDRFGTTRRPKRSYTTHNYCPVCCVWFTKDQHIKMKDSFLRCICCHQKLRTLARNKKPMKRRQRLEVLRRQKELEQKIEVAVQAMYTM